MENNRYPEDQPYREPAAPEERPHSSLGLASFIIALVVIGLSVILSIIASQMLPNIEQLVNMDPDAITGEYIMEYAPGLAIVGIMVLLIVFANFIGGLLGLISLFMSNTKKLYGIMGLILNMLGVFILIFIMGIVIALTAAT